MDADPRDLLILALSDRLYICSRLLTRAAERLSWDSGAVQDLIEELRNSLEDRTDAGVE